MDKYINIGINHTSGCPTDYQTGLTFDQMKHTRKALKIKPIFKHPLYLYSSGGSGNTWARVLFQYVTGIATGSMYKDGKLKHISQYEGMCTDNLLLCKCHPLWFYTRDPPVVIDPYGFFQKQRRSQSHRLIHEADGLVWIIRDPWHAIWSLYQLRFFGYKSHSNRIQKSEWKIDLFWRDVYTGFVDTSLTEQWKMQFEIARILCKDPYRKWMKDDGIETVEDCFRDRIVQVQYEQFIDKTQRIEAFMKVLKHVYDLGDDKTDPEYFGYIDMNENWEVLKFTDYDGLLERIECAFNFKDEKSKDFHRSHNKSDDELVDMEYAYMSLGEERVCRIWHTLKPYAEEFGYKQLLLDKFDCESKEYFKDIIDIDNVNNPNMSVFDKNFPKEDVKWWKQYEERHNMKSQLSHNDWQIQWRTIAV